MKKLFMCLLAAAFISGAMTAFAQSIDPGAGVKLTLNKSYYPVWSPDGQWIAGCGGWDGVWVTPAAGGTSTKLIGPSAVPMITRKMGFTPDSKEVIYTSYILDPNRGTIVTTWKTAGGSETLNEIPVLMAIDIQIKKTRVIREEAELGQYSRSGRYFGYINYDHRAVTDPPNAAHHYSLALYDSLSAETRYLTEGLGTRTHNFSFSGDESYIAAAVEDTASVNNRYRICIIPLDGGAPKDIAWKDNPWGLRTFTNPEYSPDGRWILYTAMTNDKRMLFSYDTLSGKTTPVFPETTVWNTDATWSPDGKKFCCQLELKSSGTGALYTFDFNAADLGVRPELAEVPLYIPRAYGKKLVDFSLDSISREDNAKYAAYANLRDQEYSPVWSPDGREIAFANTYCSTLWTVSSEGGMPALAADYTNAYDYKGYKLTLDYPLQVVYSSDGKRLVFPSWIVDESRGTVVTITEGPTPSGGYHYEGSISKPVNVIKELNIETGETRVVLDSAYNPVYSHNGRYLAYTAGSNSYLSLYNTVTGESKSLNSSKSKPYCFSPDDSFIISRVGSDGLYRVPLDGSPAELLYTGKYSSADISPDGNLMLFQGTVDGKSGLFVYEIKSGVQYPFLISADGFWCSEGKISPDGKKVCYLLSYDGDSDWTHTYVRDFNPADIGIPVAVNESAPAPFALTGNYPNPFNPSTTIGFTLNTPGRVQLAVYTLSGQKVRELIPGAFLQSGKYSVVWDGRDESGRAVSTGVYFTRLMQGSKTVSRKMTLMK